jgi:hypothetical protein
VELLNIYEKMNRALWIARRYYPVSENQYMLAVLKAFEVELDES